MTTTPPSETAIEAGMDAYRSARPDGWMGLSSTERIRVTAAICAAAPHVESEALLRAAEEWASCESAPLAGKFYRWLRARAEAVGTEERG